MGIRIKDNAGIGYRDALDGILRELQDHYKISRHDARFLFANALCRSCVYDEIIGTCNALLGLPNDEEGD